MHVFPYDHLSLISVQRFLDCFQVIRGQCRIICCNVLNVFSVLDADSNLHSIILPIATLLNFLRLPHRNHRFLKWYQHCLSISCKRVFTKYARYFFCPASMLLSASSIILLAINVVISFILSFPFLFCIRIFCISFFCAITEQCR